MTAARSTSQQVSAATESTPGLYQQTLDRLGLAIAGGALRVSDTLTSDDLEARYDVSRSVVRETIRTLEALGMVATRRRVGVTVLPMRDWNVFDLQVIRWRLASSTRISQLRSITELRSAIEPQAARLASVRAPLTRASDLVGLAGRLWAAGKSGDSEEFLRLDIEFHALVLDMSGNEMFSKLHSIVAEVLTGRTHYGLMPELPHEEALQLHTDVAGAIQRGDEDGASEAMHRIMQRNLAEMSAVWADESHDPDPSA